MTQSFKNKAVLREYETVAAMLQLYCRNQHGTSRGLCESCQTLLTYADDRLAKCPFSENKWPCSTCRVHCFREPQRSQIRDVMCAIPVRECCGFIR